MGGNYRALFNQSIIPIALISLRRDPRFVVASRGFLDTFNLRRRAVVGRGLDEVFKPRDNAGLSAAIDRCLSTSRSVRTSVEVQIGESRRFIDLAVHRAGARSFAHHVILEAEGRGHAVHSAEQRLSSLIDRVGGHGQSMTYIHNLKTRRVRYVGGSLAERVGLSGGTAQLGEFLAKVHPDDLADLTAYEATRRNLGDEEVATQTIRLRDRLGDWLLINFRAMVLRRSRKGAPRVMLGVATDITDFAATAIEAAGISVIRAEENERARIGRELHDSTSQYLVAADLGLTRTLQSEQLSPDGRERLLDVQASLSAAQTEIRAFAYFLHPPELRELGLLKTVEKFCAGFARRSGLNIAFTSHDVPANLSSDTEHALLRVCQEALMNVYRHAFAQGVSVSLQGIGEHLEMEIRDDGIGVDDVNEFEHSGIGLAGMKARLLSVGGDLSLDYRGPGLAVLARVPTPRALPAPAAIETPASRKRVRPPRVKAKKTTEPWPLGGDTLEPR